MNGIDAIIALCALTAGFALLITAVNEQQKNSNEALDSLKTKTATLECSAIIDFLYSNTAEEYNQNLACGANENTVTLQTGTKTKNTPIITSAKKGNGLEIEMLEHYAK